MNRHTNWFWGVAFVLAAVLIIAGQFVSFLYINPFTLLATILLIAVIVQSSIHRNFFGIFLPIAILYMLYDHPFRLPYIAGWQLIAAALLLSVGCSMLFGRKPPKEAPYAQMGYQQAAGSDNNNP